MFWQMGIIGLTAYGLYRKTYKEEIKFKKTLQEICEKGEGFFNRQMETLKVNKVEVTNYGYEAEVGIPYGLSFEFLEEMKALFESNFGSKEVILERDTQSSMLHMTVITKPLKDLKYKTIKTKVNEIYVGYTHKEHVIVNLDSFNNVLIAGCQGTGKSRLLLTVLANIISQENNVDLYFAQVRKSDLRVFEDCKQVKYFSRNLEDTCNLLKYLDETICVEREKMIDRYTKQGIYNITDYNNRFKNNQLSRIIVALDEFSFFMPNSSDSTARKRIKNKCIDHITNIVRAGRSSGLTIITSLQKPTKSSIPNDIKNLLATRISFKQMDIPSSVAILNNGNATELEVREAIVQTNEEEHIKVPFIDHNILIKHIKNSMEHNHQFIKLRTNEIKLPELENKFKINNLPYIKNLSSDRYNKFTRNKEEPQKFNESGTKLKEELKEVAVEGKDEGVIDISKIKKVVLNNVDK